MSVLNVYLDQNHWIYLSKDYWGKKHEKAPKGISVYLKERVVSDRIRLPLNTLHLIEHGKAEDLGRRRRLAEVFELYSCGWYMAAAKHVLPIEIRRSIIKIFNESIPLPEIDIFGKGYIFGLGPVEKELLFQGWDEHKIKLFKDISGIPWATYDLLTQQNEFGRNNQNLYISNLDLKEAAEAEDLRFKMKHYSREIHRRARYCRCFLGLNKDIILALDAVGRTMGDFVGLGQERVIKFMSSVPSIDVDCELTIYRDRQWSKPVDPNDTRDIASLALAIPYCDIVLTERFWARAIKETGLDDKYNTKVFTDLSELLESLC